MDIARNRIVIIYTLLLGIISVSMFWLESSSEKGLLSLLNVTLLFVPLVSMIFSTIYYYNSQEFMEVLLAQPLHRKKLILGLYLALAISLSASFLIGAGLPVLLYNGTTTGLLLVVMGLLLTFVFVGIAFFASVYTRDKAKGIGLAILMWFFFGVLYDGLVLLILFAFNEYPLEGTTLLMTALNPIDMARISLLLQMDISALMGYTGAVFQDVFGSGYGIPLTICILLCWMVIPFWLAMRKFVRKDI
ncbi:MAG: ABC transporter permease subunit [Flavobacteriales bacterium]|nr:ABC transporter permease subunit [Flavobacteriales bacterium]